MMIAPDMLILFFTTSLVLAVAPGPDNLFVMTQAAQRGRSAGLFVTLGLCTGLIVHTSAVAFGLAAVFKASALAFTLLKVGGAAYLLFLAWQAFRASGEEGDTAEAVALERGKLYRRGIIMNVTNPKVSIFFLAFLPQFADPGKGRLTLQFLILGAIFIVATILVFGALSILGGALGDRLRRSALTRKIINRAAGTIFAGLAVKLALARN